jgi:hypothetical protein
VEVGDSGKICESAHLPFSIHRRAVRSARPEDLISVSLSLSLLGRLIFCPWFRMGRLNLQPTRATAARIFVFWQMRHKIIMVPSKSIIEQCVLAKAKKTTVSCSKISPLIFLLLIS